MRNLTIPSLMVAMLFVGVLVFAIWFFPNHAQSDFYKDAFTSSLVSPERLSVTRPFGNHGGHRTYTLFSDGSIEVASNEDGDSPMYFVGLGAKGHIIRIEEIGSHRSISLVQADFVDNLELVKKARTICNEARYMKKLLPKPTRQFLENAKQRGFDYAEFAKN